MYEKVNKLFRALKINNVDTFQDLVSGAGRAEDVSRESEGPLHVDRLLNGAACWFL